MIDSWYAAAGIARSLAVATFLTTTLESLFAVEQPNIVLIIADNLGDGDGGPYGNPGVRTPSLHRLMEDDRARPSYD